MIQQEHRHLDLCTPGENWFFYWKTSVSLWSAKIENFPTIGPLLVPINWSFHSSDGMTYYFSTERPETDLKTLFEMTQSLGREILFLLPLTPVPFLANGGLPMNLARICAQNEDGLNYTISDSHGQVHKFYSYFDPRIFKCFRKFVWELGHYFSQNQITSNIVGLYSGHYQEKKFKSFFEDDSPLFDQGYARFVEVKENTQQFEQGSQPEGSAKENEIQNIEKNHLRDNLILREKIRKKEYSETIKDLYLGSARENLHENWYGEIKIAFLGAGPGDILRRSLGLQNKSDYTDLIFNIQTIDVIPSSILLTDRERKGCVEQLLHDLMGSAFWQKKIASGLYDDEFYAAFEQILFFEFYRHKEDTDGMEIWDHLGLLNFLNVNFKNTLIIKDNFLHLHECDYASEKVHFFIGRGMTLEEFHVMLKIFLNGGSVVLDHTELSAELGRRLHIFYVENNIEVKKINHLTEITLAQIGEGQFISLNNHTLINMTFSKKTSFWENLIGIFNIVHLPIKEEQGVNYFWRKRGPSPNELNFEEVRRLCILNPTAYKKKVKINLHKSFVLLKVVDEERVELRNSALGIDIILLPEGRVALDFGYSN